MANKVLEAIRRYNHPPKHEAIVHEVKDIFRNYDTGKSTPPDTIKNLELLVNNQVSSYRKGIVLGAIITALGGGALIFGPEFAETAGSPNFANYVVRGLEALAAFSGLVHMIRTHSLYGNIKENLDEGIRYGMFSMKTPDRKM